MLAVPGAASSDAVDAVVVPAEQAYPAGSSQPILRALSAAWAIPADELDERVTRLRRAGAALGLANLEAPAQALLIDDTGTAYERARGARGLAPDLPAARAAFARAAWSQGEPATAWRELLAATAAVGHHVESRSWLRLAAWQAAAFALLWAGAGFLLLAAAVSLPALIRQLGVLAPDQPAAGRLAALGALLLLPAALGEGLFGVCCSAMALAALRMSTAGRLALAGAGALTLLAIHPFPDLAAGARTGLLRASTPLAAQLVERGVASPVEHARVARLSERDPLAARARGLAARRAGAFDDADALFSRWAEGAGPEALSNAASVKLALGEPEAAVTALELAAGGSDDPVILFNLSQVYGGLVRIEHQNAALARAQTIDQDRTHALVASFDAGQLVDRPLRPVAATLASGPAPAGVPSASAIAEGLRRRSAPGVLGRSPVPAAGALLGALLVGSLLGAVLGRTLRGADRGPRIAGLAEGRGGDTNDRLRRLGALRRREALRSRAESVFQVLVPGAAALLGGRPVLGLLSVAWGALVLAVAYVPAGVPPAPLALGTWPAVVLPLIVGVGVAVHAALTVLAVRWRGAA